MPDSLRNFLLAHENLWILQVFGVVLGTALVALGMRGLLRFLQARFSKTRTLWDDAAIIAARRPLQALIWVLGLNVAARVIVRETGSDLFQHAGEVRELLLIAIGAWFLLRFIREAEYALTHPTDGLPGVDVTSSKAIAKLLRITVIITAVLMLLQKLGYSISGVLAFGGIGGIAVGFAAKDLLANFFVRGGGPDEQRSDEVATAPGTGLGASGAQQVGDGRLALRVALPELLEIGHDRPPVTSARWWLALSLARARESRLFTVPAGSPRTDAVWASDSWTK